ncbi:hypothetical protein ACE102_33760 [Bradyrhizobium sp. vgs-9]|uniref:hypothetical protein n=1 Tax=Bradyrhizobium sp. vgs-9 TaxID=208389 RepID=UPI0035D4454D
MSVTDSASDLGRDVLSEDEAKKLIGTDIPGMIDWYWQEALKWERYSWRLQVGFFVLSALVTVVAALPTATTDPEKWIKWVVVCLSALTTLFAGLLSKAGTERTAQLRETGRVKLTAHKQKAILLFTGKPMTRAERLEELQALYNTATEVELRYGVNPLVAAKLSSDSETATPKQPAEDHAS